MIYVDLMKQYLVVVMIFLGCILICPTAFADSASNNSDVADKLPASNKQPSLAELDHAWLVNKQVQQWGQGLLGSGIGLCAVGILLIEIDSYGSLGQAGFSTIGTGVGFMAIGMFLLGFSHPSHAKPSSFHFTASSVRGGGASIGAVKYF
jgi:hypothetical protein